MSNYSNSNLDLFDDAGSGVSQQTFQRVDMPEADVILFKSFFDSARSDACFVELDESAAWKQEKIKLYGRLIDLPRLTAWYGDEGRSYTYSGITVSPQPWTPVLLKIKKEVEAVSGVEFNSVLLNRYRDERDSVAWHSDDEPELGSNPVIGSVTFGEARQFQFKHKTRGLRHNVVLPHGSYLLMRGATQHHWLHQIPKQSARRGPRINLTFRVIQ
jgi:alkylated DNA repair dioxygenase AlkB